MLRAAILLLFTLAAGCAAVPAPTTVSFRSQVERHVAAIMARDLDEIEATITSGETLLLILPSGTMSRTRADYMTFHRSLFGNDQWAMTFEPVHLESSGDYGHALFRVTFDGDGAGPAPSNPAFLSLGFRLERGEWRLVHDQNTTIASAP